MEVVQGEVKTYASRGSTRPGPASPRGTHWRRGVRHYRPHPAERHSRASSIVARVDPVATGLLRAVEGGRFALAQDPPHIEGFINHLSDHDFLFSGDSAAIMIKALNDVASGYGIDVKATPARFNLFRNLVFAQIADMRLYGALQTGGLPAVQAMIAAEADLSQLSL